MNQVKKELGYKSQLYINSVLHICNHRIQLAELNGKKTVKDD